MNESSESFLNQSDIDVNYPTVAVAVISFVFCYVFFCILQKGPKSFNQRFIDKCKKKGTCTQGYAVSSQFIRGDDESSAHTHRAHKRRVKYEYKVDGQIYHKTITFSAGGRVSVKYPRSITIYYDEKNPRRAAVYKGEAKIGSYLLAFIIPVVLTLLTSHLT